MQVLVTGAHGFTGRYVTERLALRGHDVRAFDADLTDATAVMETVAGGRIDAVIHLGGLAFVAGDDYAAYYLVNQLGSYHLLAALAAHHRGARVVLASSSNVYGRSAAGSIDENVSPAPVSHYALSKLAMEQGARLWSEELSITTARLFNYTGVGQTGDFLIPKIVAHLRQGCDHVLLGAIDIRRDFGDVRDVAAAYVGLIETEAAGGQTVNVCTGHALSVREILEIATRHCGREIAVQTDPALLRRNEIAHLVGDNSALRRLLPTWQPRGIEETVCWMLDQ